MSDVSRILVKGVRETRRTNEGCVHRNGFKNSVLNALGADIIGRLGLQPVQFELMHEIEYPGSPIDRIYFLEEGMASITTTFKDGAQVEVGMFGYESIIGVSALMGTKRSLNRVYSKRLRMAVWTRLTAGGHS